MISEKALVRHMTLETWHGLLLWASVIFAILAAVSTGAAIFTGDAIDRKKDATIASLQPRHVGPEQRQKLIALLMPIPKPKEPIFFNSVMASGEAVQFSEEIKAVLSQAGFKTTDVDFGERLIGFGGTGVFLQFRDEKEQPQAARYIYEAFKRIGIIFSALPEPGFGDKEKVVVVVSTHP